MESWDLPIARNALRTRAEVESSLRQILEPLEGCFARGGSGLHAGNSSAHYDEVASLLEGFSRTLWGSGPLAAGGGSSPFVGRSVRALAAGTDPSGPGYWGSGGDRDQRYVEMASISLCLLIAPRSFWEPLSAKEKDDLSAWLAAINEVELPPTNWEFFRVLVNLALRRLGRAFSPTRLEKALAAIDALYRDEGWYVDETNYDYYNPFAFQFYGLVYAALFENEDPTRCAIFRERSRLFARSYLPWFASDGSSIPHGRSLAYRFAVSAFWSACAFAGEAVLPWGALKGLVLRNLRWWLARPVFDRGGLLTIGYAYPNLLMAEQYIGPGSPYWALKTYLILALPENHPFWTAEEAPLPPLPEVSHNAPPRMLICRAGGAAGAGAEHVYALAAGQYPCWESVNAAAKYAKFAYSNLFGFCVSHGSYDLPKLGCDSMLALSEGDGYWRERRATSDRYSCADYVRSAWAPWPDVKITTWLVPFGLWHLRVHAIDSARTLLAAEGGFSLPDQNALETAPRPGIGREEGALFASFPWAFGAIADLSPGAARRAAELHKPEPNLNLLYPKVLVPMLSGRIAAGKSILACAVAGGAVTGGAVTGGAVGALAVGTDAAGHVAGLAGRPSFAYDPISGLGVASTGASATGAMPTGAAGNADGLGERRVEFGIGPGYGALP